MTAVEAPDAFPELGAKSPEKTKPKSAPRGNTRGGGASGNSKPRERKDIPDDGAPLVPPTPVKEPSQEEQEAVEAKLKGELDAELKKVDDLTEAIENAREARSQHNDDTKSIREEMQQLRTKSNQIAAERDGLVDQLKKNTDGTRALETQAAKLRKELKVQDSAQIDKVIKEMTEKLETSSMDLKSEKTLVNEIKNITAQKEQLKEWEEVKAKIEARKQANDVLYKKRQEVGEKLTASREAEKAINVKLDSFKSGDGTADGVAPHTKMMELMDQKTKVIEGIKAKRQGLKDASTQFRFKVAEYREYQKAVQAYERKVESREWNKRRAERAEKQEAWKADQKARDVQRKVERAKIEARFAAVAKGVQMFVGGVAIRSSDEDLEAHFKKFGEILDCVIVRDNESKVSKGFGFVTMATREEAEAAIKECNGTEVQKLCPPHGRISVKFAEKSKMQVEWENKQKEREAKAAEAKEKKKEEKKEDEPAAADAEEEGAPPDHDDFFAAFAGGSGKVELPPKVEEVPKKAEAASPKKESASPKKESASPKKESASPKKESAAPAEEEEEEAAVDDDDFSAAFAGGSDKVELPPKVEEKKAEDPQKEEEKKEGWHATRTEWVAKEGEVEKKPEDKAEDNEEEGEDNKEEGEAADSSGEKKKKKKKSKK